MSPGFSCWSVRSDSMYITFDMVNDVKRSRDIEEPNPALLQKGHDAGREN